MRYKCKHNLYMYVNVVFALCSCQYLILDTVLGAHSIPKGSTEEEYTKDIIERQIPEIKVRLFSLNEFFNTE